MVVTCADHSSAASRQDLCPSRVRDLWGAAPAAGFHPLTAQAMGCHGDGSWRPPGTSVSFTHSSGLGRTNALSPTRAFCQRTRWAQFGPWRSGRRDGAPVLGTPADVSAALAGPPKLNATLLAAFSDPASYRRRAVGVQLLYSPCLNLAFVACALRGWLRGQPVPGGQPVLRLASRGSELRRSCTPCDEARGGPGGGWDLCFLTHMEYCFLSLGCVNGAAEAWRRTGLWRCRPNASALQDTV